MTKTSGFVHCLQVLDNATDHPSVVAYIGPDPDNAALLTIQREPNMSSQQLAQRTQMLQLLEDALMHDQPVIASHGELDSRIVQLSLLRS